LCKRGQRLRASCGAQRQIAFVSQQHLEQCAMVNFIADHEHGGS
jgi:hypothetical protein